MSSREIMNSMDGKPTYDKANLTNKKTIISNGIKQKDSVRPNGAHEVR